MESWIIFKSLHCVNYIWGLHVCSFFPFKSLFRRNKLFLASFFIFPQGIPSLSEILNSKTKIKIILHIFVSPTARQKQQILGKKNVMATPKHHKLKFKWQPNRKTFSMFKINALQTEQQFDIFFPRQKKCKRKNLYQKHSPKWLKIVYFKYSTENLMALYLF